MLPSDLDDIAFAFEPVWDRTRRICASRLTVHAVHNKPVDLVRLLGVLIDDFPADAPPLLLTTTSPALLVALLKQAPVRNTWLEVPEFIWAKTEARELLLQARRYGHQLLWSGPLGRFGEYAKKFQGLRGVLEVSTEDALQALQADAQGGEFSVPGHVQRLESPIVAGHLYRGVSSRLLADHCLDKRQAWGLVGWPEDELLSAKAQQPIPMDQRVCVQVMQALAAEATVQQVEALLIQDPVLVYRLLRMVNSASFGLTHEVESVRHALMMLGYVQLTRWLMDVQKTASADRSLLPLRHAMLMRTRLMRLLLGPNSDDELKGEVQLAGVFSHLDRLLKEPLAELLRQLPLSSRVFNSLVRREGPYVAYLETARALANPDAVSMLPGICERSGFTLDEANRAVIELLATAREPVGQTFVPARGL
ncbi:MAG: HDOD domain-containing protein [Burkholderiaceae bacterium]|nr:HDOD domain-containing protein [Burkholderiaceae bacterium]